MIEMSSFKRKKMNLNPSEIKVVKRLLGGVVEATDGKSTFILKAAKTPTEVESTIAVQKFYPNVVKYLDNFTCRTNIREFIRDEPEAQVCTDKGELEQFLAVEKLTSIRDFFKTKKPEDHTLVHTSIIRQLTCTLQIMQDTLGFIHGDLGDWNVMCRPTENKTITYQINSKDYVIPTEGIYVVIIDFETAQFKGEGKLDNMSRMEDIFNYIIDDDMFSIFYCSHGIKINNPDRGVWEIESYDIPFQPINIEEYIQNPKAYALKVMMNLKYPDFFATKLSDSNSVILDIPPLS